MNDLTFSPEERERASAFVKAFGKVHPEKEQKSAVKSEKNQEVPFEEVKKVFPDSMPKPLGKAAAAKTAGAEGAPVKEPKVTIGAEYNALKKQEEEMAELKNKNIPRVHPLSKVFLLLVCVVLAVSLYNFYSIYQLQNTQQKILSNQKLLFEKLARIGKGIAQRR